MTLPLYGVNIVVQDSSHVGEARREAVTFANRLGFDEETTGRVSIVATEAARNLHLHGGGGELLLTGFQCRKPSAIELLAIDRGPGMHDITRCMRDGYSTAGTPGTGLGAIARLADGFDVYSVPGKGTVLMARFLSKRSLREHSELSLEFSVACVAHAGEDLCGDAWAFERSPNGGTFLVVDGLGHGQFAEEAAQEAVRIFRQFCSAKVMEILERMHGVLRSTRGAAVALARINLQQQKLIFTGVGNISAAVTSNGSSRSMVSLNGTVGHEMRKVQEFSYPWAEDSLLIMHSDGLGTRWDLGSYPGLGRRSPGVIAGVLYRDFSRHRDDVTVLVTRQAQAQQL